MHDDAGSMDRRRFLVSAGMLGAAAWLAPGRLAAGRQLTIPEQARRAAAADPIGVHRLRGGVAVLTGCGGNVTVLPGPDGTLLVDAGIVGPRIGAAVAALTRAPIRHVVNTHWHFDHTDANGWLASRGATVVAHEMARQRLSRDTRVEDWAFTFRRTPPAALPGTVFRSGHTLSHGGSPVELAHYPAAHTDTDVVAHLAGPDVISTGDTWWNGIYPFIDLSTGGGIHGMIAGLERTLGRMSAGTLAVPGHGAVGGRAELRRDLDMLAAIRDRVAALKRRGLTLEETIAARPTAPWDATAARAVITPAWFTRLVYRGV